MSKRPFKKPKKAQTTLPRIGDLGYYGQTINLPKGLSRNGVTGDLQQLGNGLMTIPGTVGSSGSNLGTGTAPNSGIGTTSNNTVFNRTGMYSGDSSYADLLKGLGSDDPLIQTLQNMGIDLDKEMYRSQDDEWNRTLLGTILQQYVTNNQRDYDRWLQLDQRTYDSPTNQLARLMGAGISRDAALQLLGAGSGAGGSVPFGSTGAAVGDGSAAVDAMSAQVDKATSIAGTVFNAVGAAASLVGLGFSVPQAIQQTKYLSNQNNLTRRQLAAYDSASAAYNVLSDIGAGADAFGSIGSAVSAIESAAAGGNVSAQQFIANGGIQQMRDNSYFVSRAIHEQYLNERASSDYAKSFTAGLDQIKSQTMLNSFNSQKAAQEAAKLSKELSYYDDVVHAELAVKAAQVGLLLAQGKNEEAQTLHLELMNERDAALNNYETIDPNTGQKVRGVDIMAGFQVEDLHTQLLTLTELKNKDQWKIQANQILNDTKAMQNLAIIHYLASNRAADWQLENPELFKLAYCFDKCGLASYAASLAQNTVMKRSNWGDIDFSTDRDWMYLFGLPLIGNRK